MAIQPNGLIASLCHSLRASSTTVGGQRPLPFVEPCVDNAIKQSLELDDINRVVIFGSFYTIADATLIIDQI